MIATFFRRQALFYEKTEQSAALRVALYIRVSGQEQAIKGLSPEAQQEDPEEYARSKGWIIQGVYIDAAKTARKSLGKRENFLRMLEAVKRDQVDMILFILWSGFISLNFSYILQIGVWSLSRTSTRCLAMIG